MTSRPAWLPSPSRGESLLPLDPHDAVPPSTQATILWKPPWPLELLGLYVDPVVASDFLVLQINIDGARQLVMASGVPASFFGEHPESVLFEPLRHPDKHPLELVVFNMGKVPLLCQGALHVRQLKGG